MRQLTASAPGLSRDADRVRAWELFAKTAGINISRLTTPQALRLIDCTGSSTGGRLLAPSEIAESADPSLTPRRRDLAVAAWFLCS